jgi:putative transposase
MGQVLRSLQMRHSQHVNAAQGTTGHLWHGRYYSCVLDEPHLISAVRYVERNPVRSGLVARAEQYAWSSAAPHCGLRTDPVISDGLPLLGMVNDWERWLMEPGDEPALIRLRHRTLDGRPCGSGDFAESVAACLGRDLSRKPVGRPRKTRDRP